MVYSRMASDGITSSLARTLSTTSMTMILASIALPRLTSATMMTTDAIVLSTSESCVSCATAFVLGASLEAFKSVVNDAFKQGGFCFSEPVEFTLSPALRQFAVI